MKTFLESLEEATDSISANRGKVKSCAIVVTCGRGHNTTIKNPGLIRSDSYYGTHIVWECSQCPPHNADFVVNL